MDNKLEQEFRRKFSNHIKNEHWVTAIWEWLAIQTNYKSFPLDAEVMKKAMGEMNNCFLCGSQAHWQKCNKRWGIFCDGCRAMTGYYDKKEDALKHWNNEYPLKQKPTEEQMNNMIKLMRER